MTKGPNITYVYALENHYALKKKKFCFASKNTTRKKYSFYKQSMCQTLTLEYQINLSAR